MKPELIVSSHIFSETKTRWLEVDTQEDKWSERGREGGVPQRKGARKKGNKKGREQQRKREREKQEKEILRLKRRWGGLRGYQKTDRKTWWPQNFENEIQGHLRTFQDIFELFSGHLTPQFKGHFRRIS